MATPYPNPKDASLKLTKYLPAAGATNNTATHDLETTDGKLLPRWFEITVPAMSGHTDTSKNITFTLQDSADDSSYANVNPLIQADVAGVASTGSAATTFRVPIPPTVRRYLQFTQAVEAGGPTVTTTLITYEPISF